MWVGCGIRKRDNFKKTYCKKARGGGRKGKKKHNAFTPTQTQSNTPCLSCSKTSYLAEAISKPQPVISLPPPLLTPKEPKEHTYDDCSFQRTPIRRPRAAQPSFPRRNALLGRALQLEPGLVKIKSLLSILSSTKGENIFPKHKRLPFVLPRCCVLACCSNPPESHAALCRRQVRINMLMTLTAPEEL